MSDATPPAAPNAGEWMGHPKGLFYLFFAEMWERFCFYGMRNILVLYMVHYFAYSDEFAQKGPYAAYTSLIYCVAIFGGYVADRFMGYRRSIMMGGVLMAVGMFMLVINNDVLGFVGLSLARSAEEVFFYGGMSVLIVGNGFFKPNISTIVGKLYPPSDPRRDGGFTIFYMGINIGALLGGIVCAEIGQRVSWTLGFGIAAAGMLLGVFTFGTNAARNSLMGYGEPRDEAEAKRTFPIILGGALLLVPVFYYLLQNSEIVGWILGGTGLVMLATLLTVAFKETKEQRERLFALMILVLFNPVFWAFFEQAGSSLTLFADRNLDRSFLGIDLASGTIQNFNAFFIIALAPVFAWMWVRLGKRNPSIPLKFALGLAQLGLGFMVLVWGARYFSTDGITPIWFMIGLYLFLTTGELCLSPVGLSMVTKLAPERMTGMVMGVWFLSIAGANFLAGQIAALTGATEGEGVVAESVEIDIMETLDKSAGVYENSAYFVFGATALLMLLVPLLKKWMHGVK